MVIMSTPTEDPTLTMCVQGISITLHTAVDPEDVAVDALVRVPAPAQAADEPAAVKRMLTMFLLVGISRNKTTSFTCSVSTKEQHIYNRKRA